MRLDLVADLRCVVCLDALTCMASRTEGDHVIEEDAEPRHGSLRARKITVKIVGYAHQAVEREGDHIVEWLGAGPEQENQEGNRKNTRKRQYVRQRQHSCCTHSVLALCCGEFDWTRLRARL